MYNPLLFYEDSTDKFQPGDIIFIKNWGLIDNSYWLIITSLCDLEHRDYIAMAKIKDLDSIENIDEGKKGDIRRFRYGYYFYLPPLDGEFGESIVHYGILSSFSKIMLEQARMNANDLKAIKSLSEDSRRLFQFHFANHITRDETKQLLRPHIDGLVKILDRLSKLDS